MVVGELETTVDVLVLGAGPGGYVAAIRAAQLGKQVVLVDPGPPGGTCLHQGCIPAKALLTAANHYRQLPQLAQMGISTGKTKINLEQTHAWKERLIKRLSGGITHLLDKNKVAVVQGKGWFLDKNRVLVEAEYGSERFIFEQAIIAVGASPLAVPGLAFDGKRVLTPAQALNLTKLPKQITVIGSDYIAAELSTYFAKLGSAVQLLVPAGRQFLEDFPPAAGRPVQSRLKKLGVKIKSKVADLPAATANAEKVVVSAGLRPNTDSLHLENVGAIADEHGFIPVNDQMQSSNPAIFAVGDVTGGPPLAHIAIKQGKVAAESLAGLPAQYAPQAVPRVVWTEPQVATVGLSAAEAEAMGYAVVTGRFPFAASGRALTLNAGEGFVETVAERENEVLLGVTIVGPQAETLIGEATLALEMGATLTDLAETLHPHPGLSEALQESAEAALGIAVHITR